MTVKKNEALSLQVTKGLQVTILPSNDHEFLMTTKQVASGYGVSDSRIRHHILEHNDELVNDKHFLSRVRIPHAARPGSYIGTLWTKRGIVRLGFFIKSQRAKLFRDWAEELIINEAEKMQVVPQKKLPAKRKHNRLTQDRLLSIMAEVAKIDDKEVRLSITGKLLEV